jgi:hypothetical protein
VSEEPKDPRSTYRRRAQRVLRTLGRHYFCGSIGYGDDDYEVNEHGCGRSPTLDDAPGGCYPGVGTLQVNHINKVLEDLDPANLEYLCASCHKEIDQTTEKGVSVIADEFGYGWD